MKNKILAFVFLLAFVFGNKIVLARETSPLIPSAPITTQASEVSTDANSSQQPANTAHKNKRLSSKKTLKTTKTRRTGRRTGRRTSKSRRFIRPKTKLTFSV